jgi:hypothetical protein
MIRYFYDTDAQVIVAFNEEASSIRVLKEINAVEDSAAAERATGKRKRAFTEAEVFPTRKTKGGGCEECGSPSRHKKTCSKAGGGAPKPSASGKTRHLMSRMTFGRVKISQSHDVAPSQIASNLDLPLEEVEHALEAEDFDEYVR